jgi:hypothetical protein
MMAHDNEEDAREQEALDTERRGGVTAEGEAYETGRAEEENHVLEGIHSRP